MKVTWRLDSRLEMKMGREPFRVLKLHVEHALQHHRIFSRRDEIETQPFMSWDQARSNLDELAGETRSWFYGRRRWLVTGGHLKLMVPFKQPGQKKATRFWLNPSDLVKVMVHSSGRVVEQAVQVFTGAVDLATPVMKEALKLAGGNLKEAFKKWMAMPEEARAGP